VVLPSILDYDNNCLSFFLYAILKRFQAAVNNNNRLLTCCLHMLSISSTNGHVIAPYRRDLATTGINLVPYRRQLFIEIVMLYEL